MAFGVIPFLFAAILVQTVVIEATSSDEYNKIRELLRGYTKEPPEGQTTLRMGIYINNLHSISHQTMDFTVSMYLRQQWQDKRLAFEPTDGQEKQSITVPDSMISEIWTPDTFFRNEKKASFHYVTVPNRLFKLNSTGWVWYVTKITSTFSCPMKLQKFPMDKQRCPIMLESYGMTMDRILFKWLHSPVDVDSSLQLPQFTLYDVDTQNCSQNYTAGWFPCGEINFFLRRDTGFYIMQIYIPSILIVILSWVAFWIAIDCTATRAGIGLTALVTMAILSVWSRSQLPVVSYATAMDVWTMICFIFVFASFLEFAAVHFLSRKEARKTSKGDEESINKPGKEITLKEAARCGRKQLASSIDMLSRIIFPLAFLLFIIIYCIAYKSG